MTFNLYFEENPDQNDVQILIHGITDYAKQQRGFDALDFFAFFIRDENNTIVGGCSGGTLYGGLHIDSLWVSDVIRNKGWGRRLVNAALTYGKEKNCNFATVNTMDWEALGFYQKLGFRIEFKRMGFHKNSIFYFLRKELLQAQLKKSALDQIEIRVFEEKDISPLVTEFARHDWHKPQSTFDLYWHEQNNNERLMWVAFHNGQLAGYATLKWESNYQSFKEQNIPEIMDLNVLPPYRNKGIGTGLLEIAEQLASTRSHLIGLGVGLYGDYGNAQKLYIKKGYIPDGLGVTYNYQSVIPGDSAPVDDDLILWFTKQLGVLNCSSKSQVISVSNAPSFKWGQDCSGWWFKNDDNFSVIYESMPVNSSEIKHYHNKIEQFFYCLQGELLIEFDDYECILKAHEGLNINPGVSHKVKNLSKSPVCFLVISSPNLSQDRVDLEYP